MTMIFQSGSLILFMWTVLMLVFQQKPLQLPNLHWEYVVVIIKVAHLLCLWENFVCALLCTTFLPLLLYYHHFQTLLYSVSSLSCGIYQVLYLLCVYEVQITSLVHCKIKESSHLEEFSSYGANEGVSELLDLSLETDYSQHFGLQEQNSFRSH